MGFFAEIFCENWKTTVALRKFLTTISPEISKFTTAGVAGCSELEMNRRGPTQGHIINIKTYVQAGNKQIQELTN